MERKDIITCLKKIKKTKRISKQIIVRLKNVYHKCNTSIKICYKIAFAKIFFVRSFINSFTIFINYLVIS